MTLITMRLFRICERPISDQELIAGLSKYYHGRLLGVLPPGFVATLQQGKMELILAIRNVEAKHQASEHFLLVNRAIENVFREAFPKRLTAMPRMQSVPVPL